MHQIHNIVLRHLWPQSWYSIDISLAMKNIKSGSIVKCKVNDEGYLFNIPNEINPNITPEMIKNGK